MGRSLKKHLIHKWNRSIDMVETLCGKDYSFTRLKTMNHTKKEDGTVVEVERCKNCTTLSTLSPTRKSTKVVILGAY